MKVRGIERMTLGELVEQVKLGGRFVVFHWCVGLLVKTVRRPSAVYFVPPGRRAAPRGAWHSLATLLTGWWAIPFGPLATVDCLRENWAGGRDVTAGVLKTLAHLELRPAGPGRGPVASNAT